VKPLSAASGWWGSTQEVGMRFGIASILLVLGASASAPGADLPRYQLAVGRQLTYAGDSAFTYQNGTMEDHVTFQITIVARNPDGSYHAIVREGQRHAQNHTGQKLTSTQPDDDRITYSAIDMRPDGQLVDKPTDDADPVEAPMVLPPLPAEAAQMGRTWKRESAISGMTRVFSSVDTPVDGIWAMKSLSEGVFNDIYGMGEELTYQFDLGKGVVTSLEMRLKQDYAFHGTGVGHTKLESDRMLSADETINLASDCQTLLDVQAANGRKLREVSAKSDAAKVQTELKASLSTAMEHISTPEIKSTLEQRRNEVDRDVSYDVEDAQRIASMVGQPLIDVQVTDMDGHARKLSEFRGKVLVLDFWYRGCGWCLRAMPQLKQVAEDFKDQPFVLVGMNTDRDDADAKFVIDALKLNYATFRISFDTSGKLNIHAFPSLLIIDGDGVVRDFHEGFTPHLRNDLDKEIRSLLGKD
jgi:thiol-disulfide isomerase/thioredoxin